MPEVLIEIQGPERGQTGTALSRQRPGPWSQCSCAEPLLMPGYSGSSPLCSAVARLGDKGSRGMRVACNAW